MNEKLFQIYLSKRADFVKAHKLKFMAGERRRHADFSTD